MSYGTNSSGVISSNDTSSFTLPLNNNADIFNLLVKPSSPFISGRLFIEVKNTANDIWETVFTANGTRAFLCCIKPRAVTIRHNSLHAVRFIPDSMEADNSYEVFVENLSSWSDG